MSVSPSVRPSVLRRQKVLVPISLSVTSFIFIPRSEALSLIITKAGVATGGEGAGGVGSDAESPRTEIAELVSGCANGTKDGAGVIVVEMLRMSRGTGGAPPMTDRPPRTEPPAAPPGTDPLPRKVSGDIPPLLPMAEVCPPI